MRAVTANVLKNRGVPLMLHVLETDAAGDAVVPYKRAFTGDGDDATPVMQEVWVQFTNSTLADIEDPEVGWGPTIDDDGNLIAAGMPSWQKDLRKRPWQAVSKTIAIVLQLWVPGRSTPSGGPVPNVRMAGMMIPEGTQAEMSSAIGAAFSIAMGAAPDTAGKLLAQGMKEATDLGQKLRETMDETVDQFTTPTGQPPGSTSSPEPQPGSVSDENSTNTGGSVLTK